MRVDDLLQGRRMRARSEPFPLLPFLRFLQRKISSVPACAHVGEVRPEPHQGDDLTGS